MSKERFTEEQKNTVTSRHWNEALTNNAILNHHPQCKDCFFRDLCVYCIQNLTHFHTVLQIEQNTKTSEICLFPRFYNSYYI